MKISENVLRLLARCATGDNKLVISSQLDRADYLALDKVLKDAGFTWNRKAKAHLFEGDASEALDQLINTGEITTRREEGFFETPASLAATLVKRAGVKAGDHVLEPSAGTGAIVRALRAVGAHVFICERNRDRRYKLLYETFKDDDRGRKPPLILGDVVANDFLEAKPPREDFLLDAVVMNPPFTKVGLGNHLDHVRHAYTFLKLHGKLVSVLPISVMQRQDKRHTEFRAWVEELEGTFIELPEGSFKESGTNVRTCVLELERRM